MATSYGGPPRPNQTLDTNVDQAAYMNFVPFFNAKEHATLEVIADKEDMKATLTAEAERNDSLQEEESSKKPRSAIVKEEHVSDSMGLSQEERTFIKGQPTFKLQDMTLDRIKGGQHYT